MRQKKRLHVYFCTGYPHRYPYKNIHESHSLRFARFFWCVPTKRNRYVDKSRNHANYSLTVSQAASLTNQPVLIISFSLMPNAVFTSYLMHHDLSINVLIKIHYLMQPILFNQPSNSRISSLVKLAESIPSPSSTCSASFFFRS